MLPAGAIVRAARKPGAAEVVRAVNGHLLAAARAAPVPDPALVEERLELPFVLARTLAQQPVLAPDSAPEDEQGDAEDEPDLVRQHVFVLPAAVDRQTCVALPTAAGARCG
jgi:hypothetical protein